MSLVRKKHKEKAVLSAGKGLRTGQFERQCNDPRLGATSVPNEGRRNSLSLSRRPCKSPLNMEKKEL